MSTDSDSSGKLRRMFTRLTASTDVLEAEQLQTDAVSDGGTPIETCCDREMVNVCGTLRTVTLRPRAGVPALEAELYDGSGSVSLDLARSSPDRRCRAGPGHPGLRPDGQARGSRRDLQPAVRAAPGHRAVTETPPQASVDTVEALVRAQLSKALGGPRGILEAAVPTAAFTICYVITDELKTSLIVAAGLAALALLVRLAQRSTTQFVFNAAFGIAIGAAFAMRGGGGEDGDDRACDFFLPGILYNTVTRRSSCCRDHAVAGGRLHGRRVTGDPTGWRNDPAMVKLCRRLTLILAVAVRPAGARPVPALRGLQRGRARHGEGDHGLAAAGGRAVRHGRACWHAAAPRSGSAHCARQKAD